MASSLASAVSDGFLGYRPSSSRVGEGQAGGGESPLFELYKKTCILGLSPGPCQCQIIGRVVAISDTRVTQTRRGPRAYLCITVADDESAIDIHLHFNFPCDDDLMTPYGDFVLGDLLTVYACVVVSESPHQRRLSPSKVGYFVTMSDSSNHSWVYKSFDDVVRNRIPFELKDDIHLRSIVPLNTLSIPDKNGSSSGQQLLHRRILVLVISCGPTEIITISGESPRKVEKRLIDIADSPCTRARLTLWGPHMTKSANFWIPSKTWLMISDFTLKHIGQNGVLHISATSSTRIYVDPILPGDDGNNVLQSKTRVLKKHYSDLTTRVYNPTLATSRFTIEEINRHAKRNPGDILYGYVDCLILKLDIVFKFSRNRLFGFTCCSTEQFTNTRQRCKCQYCYKDHNSQPRGIVGQIIDETGCILRPAMTEGAVQALLPTNDEVLVSSLDSAHTIEKRLLFTHHRFVFVVDYCSLDKSPRIVIV